MTVGTVLAAMIGERFPADVDVYESNLPSSQHLLMTDPSSPSSFVVAFLNIIAVCGIAFFIRQAPSKQESIFQLERH
jgi:hypothetical protein